MAENSRRREGLRKAVTDAIERAVIAGLTPEEVAEALGLVWPPQLFRNYVIVAKPEPEKMKVRIIWGRDKDTKTTYGFATSEEREAFLQGVEEACGWSEYEIVREWESRRGEK